MTATGFVNVLKNVAKYSKVCLAETTFSQIRNSTKGKLVFQKTDRSNLLKVQTHFSQQRKFSTNGLDDAAYEKACSETLDALSDYFEEIVEKADHLKSPDVSYGDGVLTVKFGQEYGTYVINRQSPNKQIWLSSPSSGPKRYDFVGSKTAEKGKWIYKHTGVSLHELLQNEIKNIVKSDDVNFFQLPYSKD